MTAETSAGTRSRRLGSTPTNGWQESTSGLGRSETDSRRVALQTASRFSIAVIAAVFLLTVVGLVPGTALGQDPFDGQWAPDRPEPGSVEAILEYTTDEAYRPSAVAYVPESDSVPSPHDVLGRWVGTPDVLSSVDEIHGYFRRLAEASPRVTVEVIGTSEEGREILLVSVSSEDNLAKVEAFRRATARLADPRATDRAAMKRLAADTKPFYYLLGGLHSTETGSPEMLMELAYRLAVSERDEIRAIRDGVVTLITPVVETDGRDRQVEWYKRHLQGRDLDFEQLRSFSSPPFWGKYVFHDNNRDGMQLTQALTRAVNEVYWNHHPSVIHDLHESVPLLYISTGHGPYNPGIDPVTVAEWSQLAQHEVTQLQAAGLPGVWTWGFWDGWWPGYLVSVANNHHGIGRFYETFGNSLPGTYERELSTSRYVGKPVTEVQWYRTWPPGESVTWSLRNNTNFMQSGVLAALGWAARNGDTLLENFWIKGRRAIDAGRDEAPYAWIFSPTQDDSERLVYLINQLLAHRIEVHRLTEAFEVDGTVWPPGSYVVRMDQPYRNAAKGFLEAQKFPADVPNPPYDDVAWTWPLLFGVEAEMVNDPAIFGAPLSAPIVQAELSTGGAVTMPGPAAMEQQAPIAGQGPAMAQPAPPDVGEANSSPRVDFARAGIWLLADRGQNALLRARLRFGGDRIEAADEAFEADGRSYPAGSWIVYAHQDVVDRVGREFGLTFHGTAEAPEVRRHSVDLPRLGVIHTWTSTQDAGWVRYTLDQEGIGYELVSPDELKRGGLDRRFDVLLFPNTRGSFSRIVHGIDPAYGPLAYTQTAQYPSHGQPNASNDITGGMGFAGLQALQRFVERGGLLITLAGGGTLAVDGGLVRGVRNVADGIYSPGSELRAKILRPDHPLTYGYDRWTSLFRGNGPVWDVRRRDRGRALLQFGSKEVEGPKTDDDEEAANDIVEEDVDEEPIEAETLDDEIEESGQAGEAGEAETGDGGIKIVSIEPIRTPPVDGEESDVESEAPEGGLVLSGFVRGKEKLDGKPAVIDVPVGEGRVVLFSFNPLHRYLNHSDFRLVWNLLLNWDDLPE